MTPHVGDRVLVTSIRTNHGRASAPEGTVEAIDEGGVHVRFDQPVSGLMTAYATPKECLVVSPGRP